MRARARLETGRLDRHFVHVADRTCRRMRARARLETAGKTPPSIHLRMGAEECEHVLAWKPSGVKISDGQMVRAEECEHVLACFGFGPRRLESCLDMLRQSNDLPAQFVAGATSSDGDAVPRLGRSGRARGKNPRLLGGTAWSQPSQGLEIRARPAGRLLWLPRSGAGPRCQFIVPTRAHPIWP
mgnify:CR=1 FL=1